VCGSHRPPSIRSRSPQFCLVRRLNGLWSRPCVHLHARRMACRVRGFRYPHLQALDVRRRRRESAPTVRDSRLDPSASKRTERRPRRDLGLGRAARCVVANRSHGASIIRAPRLPISHAIVPPAKSCRAQLIAAGLLAASTASGRSPLTLPSAKTFLRTPRGAFMPPRER